jgi:cytochrome c553
MRQLIHRIWFRRSGANPDGRRPGTHAWIGIVLFALFATGAGAAVHPVPLDKKTDGAKCLECHEDKAKGKSVHSAMATGCLGCHEIRVNKDVTRVVADHRYSVQPLLHLPR